MEIEFDFNVCNPDRLYNVVRENDRKRTYDHGNNSQLEASRKFQRQAKCRDRKNSAGDIGFADNIHSPVFLHNSVINIGDCLGDLENHIKQNAPALLGRESFYQDKNRTGCDGDDTCKDS